MSVTYEQTSTYEGSAGRKGRTSGIGGTILNWLGAVAERSPQGQAAANFQRLNAMSDDELARLNLTRGELLERCFGWRAHC